VFNNVLKPANEIYLFVKLKCQTNTKISSVGIKYLPFDVNKYA